MLKKMYKGHFRMRESSGLITLPARLVQREDFPLKDGWKVNIFLEGDKLIIEQGERFEHINTFENRVSIYDNALGKEIDVFLRPEALVCDFCHSISCEHVEYALSLKKVQDAYKRKGLKIPEIKK